MMKTWDTDLEGAFDGVVVVANQEDGSSLTAPSFSPNEKGVFHPQRPNPNLKNIDRVSLEFDNISAKAHGGPRSS